MIQDYLSRLAEIVKINNLSSLKEKDLFYILDKAKPIIFDGHFELNSDMHSEAFFRFHGISQYASFMKKLSEEMAALSKSMGKIDLVLGPMNQGMYFAFDFASSKKCKTAYALVDGDTGRPTADLKEGFEIRKNENVLIMDVIAESGRGLENLIEIVERNKAKVAGINLVAIRTPESERVKKIKKKYQVNSIMDLNMPYWPKENCNKLCDSERKLLTSEQISHLPLYSSPDSYQRYLEKMGKKVA